MKSKLHIPAGMLLFLVFSMASSFAQMPGGPLLGSNPPVPSPGQPPAFDPATGQPIAPSAPPDWKDNAWVDPKIVLTNVAFPDLPLSEIAENLRHQFKEEFDILMPAPPVDSALVINQFNGMPQRNRDWNQLTVNLQLRNVQASEIFNAMNLMFENDQTPLRWELKVNGMRQLAVLHVLVQHSPEQEVRKVYFVGDLIGDQKSGGMSMEQVIKTITDVWQMAGDGGGKIQFHKEAQLLVVSGTPNQIDFMEQTLSALREREHVAQPKDSKSGERVKTDGGLKTN